MDGNHPKRRKDKYNPYTILEKDGKFYVSFKDGEGAQHDIEVDSAVYALMNTFELEDLSYLNEQDRHLEQSDLLEETLAHRILDRPDSMEETVCRSWVYRQLRNAIKMLLQTQQRRLTLYYFHDLTLEKIAELEGCSVHSVFVAIERAKEKLKNFLKQV